MKSRFAFSAFCMLVAMTMATGAFAQGIFTLSAGSEPRGRMNGHAEEAGGITLFLSNGGIGTGDVGKVEIDFGVPITNTMTTTDNAITVEICDEQADFTNNVAIDDDDGTITLTVAGNVGEGTDASIAISCTDGNSINVDGVLLSLVGSGATSIEATVSVTGDVRLGGNSGNRVTVIDSVVDPLDDAAVKVGQTLKLIRHSGEPLDDAKTQFHLVITEPHNDSFDDANLRLSFSGIPEDVELVELDAWVTSKKNFDRPKDHDDKVVTDAPKNQIPIGSVNDRTAIADDDDEVVVYLSGLTYDATGEDPVGDEDEPAGMLTSGRDVVVVRGSIMGADDEDLLPIDLEIQASVDLGPIGDDDDENGNIPRFDSDTTTAMTVVESTPFQTTLNVPFAVSDGTFDTGIAVANMSTGSSAQPGAIMVDFYVGGTKMSYNTTASSGGSGLNASGMLMPGSTWLILLSELFPGEPGSGYLIITTDFTDGDGNVFITDFAGFAAAGKVREP